MNGENSRRKENNSSPRHNKWSCKKLKNCSSETDIWYFTLRSTWPVLDVVCANIPNKSSGLAEASRTTPSTGMSSSVNKELFQHVVVKVGVKEMGNINDVFFRDIADMYMSLLYYTLCWPEFMTPHAALSSSSSSSSNVHKDHRCIIV